MKLTKLSYDIINSLKSELEFNKSKEIEGLFYFLNKIKYKFKKIKYEKIKYFSLNSKFISEKYIKKAELLQNSCKYIYLINENLVLNINIHYNDENIEKFIKEIINVISFMSSISKNDINELTINYYLLEYKKEFLFNDYLDVEEVNSGFCIGNVINIYRKEEIQKVTIHELIHAFNYDYRLDTNNIEQHYNNKYNIISNPVNTFEGYVEFWAIIINSFLISKQKKKSLDYFILFINIEQHFSNYQYNIIINNYIKNNININQYTNILSYYIIKNELINNINYVLKYFSINNIDYIKTNNNSVISLLSKLNLKKKIYNKINTNTSKFSCLELDYFN